MSISKFIEPLGCKCKNIQWSWSYINDNEKFVLIGVWEHHKSYSEIPVLLYEWQFRRKDGKINPGFNETFRHLEKVINNHYSIKCFVKKTDNPDEIPVKIKKIDTSIFTGALVRREEGFFIIKQDTFLNCVDVADFHDENDEYSEGKISYFISKHRERSSEAKEECIRHYGDSCIVCSFNFRETVN